MRAEEEIINGVRNLQRSFATKEVASRLSFAGSAASKVCDVYFAWGMLVPVLQGALAACMTAPHSVAAVSVWGSGTGVELKKQVSNC